MRYWKANKPQEKHKIEVSSEELSLLIDDLEPSTKYMVDIQAVTNIGAGPRIEATVESGVTPGI